MNDTVIPALSPTEASLRAIMARRIMILDGAMGTIIQQYKLDEVAYRGGPQGRFIDFAAPADSGARELFVKGNNELLTLTQPHIIQEIHERYLAAGADLIETNTFGATTIAQDDYHMAHLAYEMNVQAAKLARAACDKYSTPDKPRFVAGALGPTPKTASISPDVNDPAARNVTFDQLVAAYLQQTRGLVEGGADVLLVETIFDTLNCKAALFAIDLFYEQNPDGGAPAADDFGHRHRCVGAHPVGPDRARLLEFHPPRKTADDRPELRAGRGADASVRGRAVEDRRHLRVYLPERRPAQPDERHGF